MCDVSNRKKEGDMQKKNDFFLLNQHQDFNEQMKLKTDLNSFNILSL